MLTDAFQQFKSKVTDDLSFDCPLHSPYNPLEVPDGDEDNIQDLAIT